MKLLKRASKTQFYPFVFPSDDGIDWELSAKNIVETQPEVIPKFIENLKEQGIEVKDLDHAKQLFLARITDSTIYQLYVNNGFNPKNLIGSHVTFLFDTITAIDIEALTKLFPNIEKIQNENSAESMKEMNKFMRQLLEEKLHDLEYPADVAEADKLSKAEVIEHLLDKEGLTVEDYKAISKFIEHVVRGFVSKKKISAPSAG